MSMVSISPLILGLQVHVPQKPIFTPSSTKAPLQWLTAKLQYLALVISLLWIFGFMGMRKRVSYGL